MIRRTSFLFLLALAVSLLAGCRNVGAAKTEYQMGDKVPAGPLTYNVVEKVWRSQLGENFSVRMPENRFLLITISAANGGSGEVSVPLLQLEAADGKSIPGIGERRRRGQLVRHAADTGATAIATGPHIVFDVPLASYRLRLSDGDSTSGHFTYVQIPLQIDDDQPTSSPMPGKQ